MNILTSYFASKAPKERKVCIAKKPYRFAPGLPKASELAPSNPWAEDWQAAYRVDLDARFPTPESLRQYFAAICETTPEPILCCYEKNPEDCHRSVLAEYVEEKLGLTLTEWRPVSGKPADGARQLPLK